MSTKKIIHELCKKGYIVIPPKVAECDFARKDKRFTNAIIFGLIVRAMDETGESSMSSKTAAKFLNRSARLVNGHIANFVKRGWIEKEIYIDPFLGSRKRMKINDDLFE